MMIVAAPSYLKTAGTPETIADLEDHNRIGFNYARAARGMALQDRG